VNLNYASQGPLHGWNIVLPEDNDGAFSNAVISLVPSFTAGQLIEILSIPSAPKILLNLMDALPTG
jgi:hypothetical protein